MEYKIRKKSFNGKQIIYYTTSTTIKKFIRVKSESEMNKLIYKWTDR